MQFFLILANVDDDDDDLNGQIFLESESNGNDEKYHFLFFDLGSLNQQY